MTGPLGHVAEFLKENPPLATIVASVVAFVGTVAAINLSNRATNARLYKQFSEDRAKEHLKRKFESRREIYLDAIDAVATAAFCIGRLSDIERTSSEILLPIGEKAGQIAKVHIVASPATSEAIAELQSMITRAITVLSFSRIPIENERLRLSGIRPNSPDEESSKRKSELNLLQELILFSDSCLAQGIILGNLSARAISLVRLELGIDLEIAYEPKIGEIASKGRVAFRTTIDAFMQDIKQTPIVWPSPTPPHLRDWPTPPAPPSAPQGTPPADTPPPRPE